MNLDVWEECSTLRLLEATTIKKKYIFPPTLSIPPAPSTHFRLIFFRSWWSPSLFTWLYQIFSVFFLCFQLISTKLDLSGKKPRISSCWRDDKLLAMPFVPKTKSPFVMAVSVYLCVCVCWRLFARIIISAWVCLCAKGLTKGLSV